MALSKKITYIGDYKEQADKIQHGYGKTNLFSTGLSSFDAYLNGGYGRTEGYEIVLLFGPTGIGKSTVGLNMIAEPIRNGTKIGLLVLEDDMPDVSNRLRQILSEEEYRKMNTGRTVLSFDQEELTKSWTLDDLLKFIEMWFDMGVELIFLDHLAFAFEGAEAIKGENEYIAQRVFMQKLNQLIKRLNKTIILVHHQNKNSGSRGMDKVVGSGAIVQASTKVIEVSEGDVLDSVNINLLKSRFTKKPGFHYCFKLIDGKLRDAA